MRLKLSSVKWRSFCPGEDELTGPLGTNFIEILIGTQTVSFKKMQLKMSSAKLRPFCLGLNELSCTCIFAWTCMYTDKRKERKRAVLHVNDNLR